MNVGPYEVLSTLGRGASGTVYRARAKTGRGEVAVKVLNRGGADAAVRFERERRLLESLGEVEGFVPLVDAGSTPGGPFLVMPYLAGGTLRDRLARGPLPVEDALALALALARSLARAHELGIIHRDLKPENVIFTASGTPLVADLGIAKHFLADVTGASASVDLSRSGLLLGTAGYMPFEQMQDASRAGPSADVFALGAILYECLAGTPAFMAETPLAVLDKVEKGKLVPLTKVRPETPRWIVSLIERALARDPGQRFQDARALVLALEAGPTIRRRGPLVAAALALIFLAGALALAQRFWHRAARLVAEGETRKDDVLAIQDFTRAIEVDPTLARAWLLRGEARARRQDRDGAFADFTRATELAPDIAPAWVSRGKVRMTSGDHAGAIQDFTRAIAREPRNAEAHDLRGETRMRQGDFTGAVQDHTRAIELAPDNAAAYSHRALLERDRTDNPEQAIADFTRAIELSPGSANWILANRGLARDRQGDKKGAIEDYTRGLALDPTQEWVFPLRGAARVEMKDWAGAIEDLVLVLGKEPTLAWCWNALGRCHDALGSPEVAREHFARAIDLDARRPIYWLDRALVLDRLKDAPGACRDYARYLELSPGGPNAVAVRERLAELSR